MAVFRFGRALDLRAGNIQPPQPHTTQTVGTISGSDPNGDINREARAGDLD